MTTGHVTALDHSIENENWRPSTTPRSYHSPEQFLEAVADEALLAGPTEASYAVTAGAAVLRRHVSPARSRMSWLCFRPGSAGC